MTLRETGAAKVNIEPVPADSKPKIAPVEDGGVKRNSQSEGWRSDGTITNKASEGVNATQTMEEHIEALEHALETGNMADVVNRYSREAFHDAATLPAVTLMNHGRFEDLSMNDIKDLFRTLDNDDSGYLDFEEVALLLKEVLSPPCSDEQIDLVYELTDKNDTGVTPEELKRALTAGPLKEHLKRLQRGNQLRIQFEKSLGVNAKVKRDLLIDWLNYIINRDDAFRTLPVSLVYISIFIFIVITHLKVFERQQLENGLAGWMEGYGGALTGPYLKDHVADVPSTYDWLTKSGLPAVLGTCSESIAGDKSTRTCPVGARGVLVGDVNLKQVKEDGSEPSVWLLDSDPAQVHLAMTPGDYLGASIAALNHLQNINWAGIDTDKLSLRFDTYQREAEMFATTEIVVVFDEYGFVTVNAYSTAVVVKPYPSAVGPLVAMIIADVIYCIFNLVPMFKETKDLIAGMRQMGWVDGFRDYWAFWNVVDWVGICIGIVNAQMWIQAVFAAQADEIQSLLHEVDDKKQLTARGKSLDVTSLEAFQDKLGTIISLYFAGHMIFGTQTLAILLKFFKAFQANPRLQLVTATMLKASSDIFHFSVVFLAVFLGFAVTGHILFGNDLAQFRSFGISLDTSFIVLMGDFGWYEEAANSDKAMGSGIPFAVVLIWFWAYMVFVLLILINMLLAIILEHYGELSGQVNSRPDACTLIQQTNNYFRQAKETKGFLSPDTLVNQLEDDDTPCHEAEEVTAASLKEAWPDMKTEQVDWLMAYLKEEARNNMSEQDDEAIQKLKTLEEQVEQIANDIHVVKLNVAVSTSKIRGEVAHPGHAPPSPSNPRARKTPTGKKSTMGFENPPPPGGIQDQVEGLTQKINASIKDLNWKIGGATEKLVQQGVSLEGTAMQFLRASQTQVGGQMIDARNFSRQSTMTANTGLIAARENSAVGQQLMALPPGTALAGRQQPTVVAASATTLTAPV